MPFPILPLLAGAAAGVIGGGMNILGNSIQSRQDLKNSKELMDYQSQIQMQQQKWLLQNQYPQQVAAMKMAGLNPAGASTSLAGMSAPSPSATMSKNVAPFDLTTGIQTMLNAKKNDAEVDLLKSEAELNRKNAGKVVQETIALDNDNSIFMTKWPLEMSYLMASSHNLTSNAMLNERKMEEVTQNISNLKKAEEQILATTEQVKTTTKLTQKEIDSYNDRIKAAIAEQLSQAAWLQGQNKREAEMMLYRQFNMSALSSYYDNQSELLKANKELMDWSIKMEKKFGNGERWIRLMDSAANAVGDAISIPFKIPMDKQPLTKKILRDYDMTGGYYQREWYE